MTDSLEAKRRCEAFEKFAWPVRGINRRRTFLMGLCTALLMVSVRSHAEKPALLLTSPDLPPGQSLDDAFDAPFVANLWGCHGGNESPALAWSGAPAGTQSFAVTMYDSYRPPSSGWWHWVIYDLPATATRLPRRAGSAEGVGLPVGAKQGLSDGDPPERRYFGPCPDPSDSPHRYIITLYALSVTRLDVSPTATAAAVEFALSAKVLAKASIVRPYRRRVGS